MQQRVSCSQIKFFSAALLKWCENKQRMPWSVLRGREKNKTKDFSPLFYGWSQEECGRKYTFSLHILILFSNRISPSRASFLGTKKRVFLTSPCASDVGWINSNPRSICMWWNRNKLSVFDCLFSAIPSPSWVVYIYFALPRNISFLNFSFRRQAQLRMKEKEENSIQYSFLIMCYSRTYILSIDITRTIKQCKQ